MVISVIIVALVIGVVLGMLFMRSIVLRTPTSGDVLIAMDEEGYYLSLELETDIEKDILSKKKVIFNVKPITTIK